MKEQKCSFKKKRQQFLDLHSLSSPSKAAEWSWSYSLFKALLLAGPQVQFMFYFFHWIRPEFFLMYL